MVQENPPFTVGCLAGQSGPVDIATCRSLYSTCGDGDVEYTSASGTFSYDLDCPCFVNGSNTQDGTKSSYGGVGDGLGNSDLPGTGSSHGANFMTSAALLAFALAAMF